MCTLKCFYLPCFYAIKKSLITKLLEPQALELKLSGGKLKKLRKIGKFMGVNVLKDLCNFNIKTGCNFDTQGRFNDSSTQIALSQ